MLALALTSLVRTTNPIILDRIDEIIGVWLSAMSETEEDAQGESVVLSQSLSSSSLPALSPSSVCHLTLPIVLLERPGSGGGSESAYAGQGRESGQQSQSSSSVVSPSPSPLWSAYNSNGDLTDRSAWPWGEGDAWDGDTMVADGSNVSLLSPYAPSIPVIDAIPEHNISNDPDNVYDIPPALNVSEIHGDDDGDDDDYDKSRDDVGNCWYSSDAYDMTDGQEEEFQRGWGEVTGNAGIQRLHAVSHHQFRSKNMLIEHVPARL